MKPGAAERSSAAWRLQGLGSGTMIKRLAKSLVIGAARRSAVIRRTAQSIVAHTCAPPDGAHQQDGYLDLKAKFIRAGKGSSVPEPVREEVVRRFEEIDRSVPIGSTPTDGLFLAELLINTQADGAVVECGCYAGGSSAKLSIIAKLVGRTMTVFDSFEGLPRVDGPFLRDHHARRSDAWVKDWDAGRYAARLDAVKANVDTYGEGSVCSYVKGWFSDTLTDEHLPGAIGFAFADVDLANSARQCLEAIWPRLGDAGVFATHDAAYIKVLQAFTDPQLWATQFHSTPPILFGAGFGLCNESPHLGYMVKGDALTPQYLKSLTIDK
jgi:predicted O-methyltransferase YrrM